MSRGYSTRTAAKGLIVLAAVEDPQNLYLPGGVQLDPAGVTYQGGTVLVAGVPLYQDSVSGLYKPWKAVKAVGAGATITALVVTDASLYAVGDDIYVGAARTVAAVDYDTNTITLSAASTWADGALLGPTNGYAAATKVSGILSDEYGVDLSDENTEQNFTARMLVRGRVKSDMVVSGDALFASIAAGDQPNLSGFQFWDGDTRDA